MSTQSSEKLGLAFSGGGFRASFFHIGILAQMAEQGLLRSVEVISTVSGGSIIGALYYLHVKKLLESKTDEYITDQDYVDIISRIEFDFLRATEKNIRLTTFKNIFKNFYMIVSPNYSRSNRIAELYNKLLYQTVISTLNTPVEMQELKIYPPESPQYFSPKKHNAFRRAKVPTLVINATTLNSGRNWQFTAQTMGEPPNGRYNENTTKFIDVDKKPIRLRRARNGYKSMVKRQQRFPLGYAVAASASVPGLFAPLAIKGLYYDRDKKESVLPLLVDGGVFDNQGTEALLDNNCTQFVISDASGQMGIENQIDSSAISSFLRVSEILQDRARSEVLLHLIEKIRDDSKIAFMDLRKGLSIREISWINEDNKPAERDKITPPKTESFGVSPKVQEKLARMRTDLDAFTEVEAYSLMRDGYLMSAKDLKIFSTDENKKKIDAQHEWRFNKVAYWMENPTPQYLKQLDIAQLTFGKVLKVFAWLWIPIIFAIAWLMYQCWPFLMNIATSSIPVYPLAILLSLWVIDKLMFKGIRFFPFLKYPYRLIHLIRSVIRGLVFCWGGLLIMLYLLICNPIYLAYGRVSKLKK
ncbi:MAG: patatin-like phospholipase family protein [Methylococcales bacterium]|nr:patatin-like phospholipase family protein [Methylococcales bacterium]